MTPSVARTRIAIAAATAVAAAALVVISIGQHDATTSAPTEAVTTSTRPARPTTSSPPSTTTPQTTTTAVTSTAGPTTTSPAPTTAVPSSPAVVIRRGDAARPLVALTFDAGSDTGHAAQILDVLDANAIDATFGMTGQWADANPALVRRMVAEGHQLVNHSYAHPSFTGRSTSTAPLSRAQRLDELARAEAAVQAAAGVSMRPWFRPPYGDEDASVRADVGSAGYRFELMWTVDSLGWQGLAVDDVVRRCLDRAEPGAIYLFHVGAASTDHAALQQIIDGLRARGLGFATASGLIGG